MKDLEAYRESPEYLTRCYHNGRRARREHQPMPQCTSNSPEAQFKRGWLDQDEAFRSWEGKSA